MSRETRRKLQAEHDQNDRAGRFLIGWVAAAVVLLVVVLEVFAR